MSQRPDHNHNETALDSLPALSNSRPPPVQLLGSTSGRTVRAGRITDASDRSGWGTPGTARWSGSEPAARRALGTGDGGDPRRFVEHNGGATGVLNVPTKVRIFLCRSAIDMRKGFDGLHGVVLEVLRQDPLSGDLFVFLNKRRDRVKLLIWEGDGLLIVYKRLQRGTFAPPAGDGDSITLSSAQLALLLGGIDLQQTRQRARYQRAGGVATRS